MEHETQDQTYELWSNGDWEALIPVIRRKIALARERNDQAQEAEALGELSFLLGETGRKRELVLMSYAELRVRRRIGTPEETAIAMSMLGAALESVGRCRSALRAYRKSVSICRLASIKAPLQPHLWTLGRILQEQGYWSESMAILDEALLLLPAAEYEVRARILEIQAAIYQGRNAWPEAIRCLQESLRLDQSEGPPSIRKCQRLGLICQKAGLIWEAKEWTDLALQRFLFLDLKEEAQRARTEFAAATSQSGHPPTSRLTAPGLKIPPLRWPQ